MVGTGDAFTPGPPSSTEPGSAGGLFIPGGTPPDGDGGGGPGGGGGDGTPGADGGNGLGSPAGAPPLIGGGGPTTATLAASDVSGAEDTAIPLGVLVDPSATATITISGVPAGAVLSAGTLNGDGTWTVASGDVPGLTITPPQDFSGSIALTITATDTGESGPLNVQVSGVADTPTLTSPDASGQENTSIPLEFEAATTDMVEHQNPAPRRQGSAR